MVKHLSKKNSSGFAAAFLGVPNTTPKKLGLLLPSGNQLAEPHFQMMLGGLSSVHTTRLRLTGSSESELLNMAQKIEDATLLLADACVDLILFHCTAVSTYSAELEQEILGRIRKVTSIPVTATSTALVESLRKVKARKIVMLSPYVEKINSAEASYLRGAGFEPLLIAGMSISEAKDMSAVLPSKWIDFVLNNIHPEADAYLISCTTVRASEIAADLEKKLKRPVITSNTAAVWHCMRVMGLNDPIKGFGQLFLT